MNQFSDRRPTARTTMTSLGASILILLLASCAGGSAGDTTAEVESDPRPTSTTEAPTTTAAPTTTTPPTTVPTTVPTTTVPAGPDPAIRSVDIPNSVLPADACEVDGWATSGPIQLSGGDGVWTDGAGTIGAEVYGAEAVGYADFDGDGREDALVVAGCTGGGTYGDQIVMPLGYIDGQLVLVGGQNIPAAATKPGLLGLDDGYGGVRLSRIHEARLEGNSVFTTEYYDATGDECNACLSGMANVQWRFTDGAWVPTLA